MDGQELVVRSKTGEGWLVLYLTHRAPVFPFLSAPSPLCCALPQVQLRAGHRYVAQLSADVAPTSTTSSANGAEKQAASSNGSAGSGPGDVPASSPGAVAEEDGAAAAASSAAVVIVEYSVQPRVSDPFRTLPPHPGIPAPPSLAARTRNSLRVRAGGTWGEGERSVLGRGCY